MDLDLLDPDLDLLDPDLDLHENGCLLQVLLLRAIITACSDKIDMSFCTDSTHSSSLCQSI